MIQINETASRRVGLALLFLVFVFGATGRGQSYCERFDADDGGWTTGGQNSSWQHGTPNGMVLNMAASGSGAWVTNLTGNYVNQELSFIESPPVDFTTETVDPELRFAHNYVLGTNDETWVEYSFDGGPFFKLGTSGTGIANWYGDDVNDWWDGNSGGWREAAHVLLGAAGHIVRVRFVLSTDEAGRGEGVAIDDVRFRDTTVTDDVGVVSIDAPLSGLLIAPSMIAVTVRNFGALVQPAFDVSFRIDGGAPVTETFVGPLAPGATASFVFQTAADFTTAGTTYAIEAETALPGDQDACNDIARADVDHFAIVSTWPYTEGFETDGGGWTTSGTASSWEDGIPTGSTISAAGGELRAWVTNLGGPYSRNEMSYLVSPLFDFTAVEAAFEPLLRFRHIFQTEGCCDRTWLEMSIDGGPFQRVGADSNAGTNWYNDAANNWWDGSSGPWRQASHPLVGAPGHVVQLRFVFQSDGSVEFEGVGVDDVAIDCYDPAYPGTGDSLILRTAVGFTVPTAGDGEDIKVVNPGDFITLEIESPTGTFVGQRYAYVYSFFDFTGGSVVPPFIFPPVAGCPCPGLYANSTTAIYTPPPLFFGVSSLIPPGGAQLSFTWPIMGSGLDLLVQAYALTSLGSNPFYASSVGHVLQEEPAEPPQIGNINPNSAAPGDVVIINGTDFALAATIDVGGIAVAPDSVTASTITFTAPAGIPCDTTVTVTNPDGQSDTFAFNPTPSFTTSPNAMGPAAGGQIMVIIGSGFSPGMTVTFDGVPAQVNNQTATLIVLIVPPGTPGTATVLIESRGGCSTTTTYTYL